MILAETLFNNFLCKISLIHGQQNPLLSLISRSHSKFPLCLFTLPGPRDTWVIGPGPAVLAAPFYFLGFLALMKFFCVWVVNTPFPYQLASQGESSRRQHTQALWLLLQGEMPIELLNGCCKTALSLCVGGCHRWWG